MAPNIRVDNDVYRFLKARAEPFADTPNTVLRRELGIDGKDGAETPSASAATRRKPRRTKSGGTSKGRTRAPSGSLLNQEAYVMPLLSSLVERGGTAPANDLIEAVGEKLDGQLTPVDKETLPSGQIRWRNRTQWARVKLVEEGLMAKDSPRGIWAITETGRTKLNGVAA